MMLANFYDDFHLLWTCPYDYYRDVDGVDDCDDDVRTVYCVLDHQLQNLDYCVRYRLSDWLLMYYYFYCCLLNSYLDYVNVNVMNVHL